MKKVFILVLATFLLSNNYLLCQLNSIEIEPTALLIGRININFERAINERNEIGISTNFYQNFFNLFEGSPLIGNPDVFKGFKISPTFKHIILVRKFKRNEKIQPTYSEYFHVKVDVGQYSSPNIEYVNNEPQSNNAGYYYRTTLSNQSFTAFGGGVCLGVKIVPVKHFYYDGSIGFQYDFPFVLSTIDQNGLSYKPMIFESWHVWGPGSIITSKFAVGFIF